MAYTTKATFINTKEYPKAYLNKGRLLGYEDGSGPRTYAEDLALISNEKDYANAIRQLNGLIEVSENESYDIAIWVGLKKEALQKSNDEIKVDDIIERVALGCPKYIRPLIHFNIDAMVAKERE